METRADTRFGCYPQCALIGSPLTEIPVVQRTDPYPFNSYLYCSELARPPLPSPPLRPPPSSLISLLADLPPLLSTPLSSLAPPLSAMSGTSSVMVLFMVSFFFLLSR